MLPISDLPVSVNYPKSPARWVHLATNTEPLLFPKFSLLSSGRFIDDGREGSDSQTLKTRITEGR